MLSNFTVVVENYKCFSTIASDELKNDKVVVIKAAKQLRFEINLEIYNFETSRKNCWVIWKRVLLEYFLTT